MRYAALIIPVLLAACGSTEEKDESDPPVELTFSVQGHEKAPFRGMRLVPVVQAVAGAVAPAEVRIRADGRRLALKTLQSREAGDIGTVLRMFKEAGFAAALQEEVADSSAWLTAEGAFQIAAKEVRKLAAKWAARGAASKGLSDQVTRRLRDALAEEAVAVMRGGGDHRERLEERWRKIVDAAIRKACPGMSRRSQRLMRDDIVRGGTGLE